MHPVLRVIASCGVRKGPDGVGTHGVDALLPLFGQRDFFRVLPLAYFCLPESARVYSFPQSVTIHYFCSGPISLDPICPQPRRAREGRVGLAGVTGFQMGSGQTFLFAEVP